MSQIDSFRASMRTCSTDKGSPRANPDADSLS